MKLITGIFLMACLFVSLTSCNKDEIITSTGLHNPNSPSNPSPPDNATGIGRFINLSWSCSDPDPNDTLRYDVFWGTATTPTTLVSSNQLAKTYGVGLAAANTTYYWRIVAKDNTGLFTEGPIWKCTTGN